MQWLSSIIKSNILKERFFIVLIYGVICLLSFTLLRTALLIKSAGQIDFTATHLAEIYLLGAFFDLITISYFSIPAILYLALLPERIFKSRIHRWLTHIIFPLSVFGLLFANVAEWFFWDEFGVRFNFISVDYLIYRHEVSGNIYETYPVITIVSILLAIAFMAYLLLHKPISKSTAAHSTFKPRAIMAGLIIAPVLFAFSPVNSDDFNFSDNRYENELAKNGIYQFFHAFRQNEINYEDFYLMEDENLTSTTLKENLKEANSQYMSNNLFDIERHIDNPGEEKHLNVMLVVVESLSAHFLGSFGNQDGNTPNLDKLADNSLLFTSLYATGTRTVRGLEAVSLSIPPTPGRSIVKRPDNSHMFSLGYVLKNKGYDTKYMYGGYSYFDNMDSFFSGNGFSVIDRSQFDESQIAFANIWGISDEDVYHRAIVEAGHSYRQQQPFFTMIMTTSNHTPYTYPQGRIEIESGTGRTGAVKYTDYAIGQLLAEAKKQPWFEDTLFVFVADHCASSAGRTSLPVERYNIPLIIYSPKHVPANKINTLASQIDVAPTLMSLMNMDYNSKFFGKNILAMQPEDGRAFISNYQELGLLTKDYLAILEPKKDVQFFRDPFGRRIKSTTGDMHIIDRLVSFYEGASYIYKHGINKTDDKRLLSHQSHPEKPTTIAN